MKSLPTMIAALSASVPSLFLVDQIAVTGIAAVAFCSSGAILQHLNLVSVPCAVSTLIS